MPQLSRRPAVLVPLAAVAVLAGTAVTLPRGGAADLEGLTATSFGAAALRSAEVRLPTQGHRAALLVDGRTVAHGRSGTLSASLSGLSEGTHTVVGEVDRGFARGEERSSRTLVVDLTPPALSVKAPAGPVPLRSPVTVTGTVERGATVRAAGGTVQQHGSAFTIRYAEAPADAEVVATDAAGNARSERVTVSTRYPDHIRGVHMTGRAWAYSKLRNPVLALARQHRINAVELDIKDEDGVVNYPTQVPLASVVGARAAFYDARRTTAQLHAMGVRVIGRIVAFNDPKLSTWAFGHGHRDWVIQTPTGGKYLYGYNKTGFGNFANQRVRDYNTDLAAEAVKLGFDDVVYDYVRRPDGPIEGMRFPGLKGLPEDSIASFLGEARAKVRPLGGMLGAAAFAQASTRPKATAQNIRKMAQHLDLVIPMDYPSHWNKGEYGVPDPYVGAYQIVRRSLVDWKRQVAGTGCVVVPWLQDENFRGVYDAAKVRQQIQGARDNGIPGWLMWSAKAVYTGAAYTPDAKPAR